QRTQSRMTDWSNWRPLNIQSSERSEALLATKTVFKTLQHNHSSRPICVGLKRTCPIRGMFMSLHLQIDSMKISLDFQGSVEDGSAKNLINWHFFDAIARFRSAVASHYPIYFNRIMAHLD